MSHSGRAQVLAIMVTTFLALVILAVIQGASAEFDSDYLDLDADTEGLNVEDLDPVEETIHARWKREDSEWKLSESTYLTKCRKLLKGHEHDSSIPQNLKTAIQEGDFSKVASRDIDEANITLLEYIPSKAFEKFSESVLAALIGKYVENNRPIVLGRLVDAIGERLDANYWLRKIEHSGGIKESNEEATSILLYSAIQKLQTGKDGKGMTSEIITRVAREGILEYIPEEKLMKVKDANTAKLLLKSVTPILLRPERKDNVDSKALTAELVELGYGGTKNWTIEILRSVAQESYIHGIPAASLKLIKPEVVTNLIKQLSEATYETPLQAKAIADVYLSKNDIPKNQEGIGNPQFLSHVTQHIGKLAAFLPGGITKDSAVLTTLIASCEKLNLPAPIKAIAGYYDGKQRSSNNKMRSLSTTEFQTIPATILKNSPPNFLKAGTSGQNLITREALEGIASHATVSKQGKTQNSYNPGVIHQLASYAVQTFGGSRGRIEFGKLPPAFSGALGIKEIIDKVAGNDMETLATNLRESPDAVDSVQKLLLLKKLIDNRREVDLAPELVCLKPRKKGELLKPEILDGLPSDSEFRLAYGSTKHMVNFYDIKRNPRIIGTLSPIQVRSIDLDEIPSVLAMVRKSKDGPQAQALQALFTRFVEYIRSKTDEQDVSAKKLIKYLTAAEISMIPGSVLAYFADSKYMKRLSDDVKLEIMIAVGELSLKDHAIIPRKTREEILSHGLAALDKSLGTDKNYTLVHLASIGQNVVDLSADQIRRLNPAATEFSLEIIQGVSEDRLKHRACLTRSQRDAWRTKILSAYGKPASWTAETVSTLCCSLDLLTEDDLTGIVKEGIANCKCASDLPPSSHLADLKKALDASCKHDIGEKAFNQPKKIFERIKTERTLDVYDIESHLFPRKARRESHNHGHAHGEHRLLNCYALRLAGSASGFDTKTLETLPTNEINNCLYEIGVDKLPHESTKILWNKFVKSWNDTVEKIPHENLRLANHILSGVSEAEVAKFNFSDTDVIAAFGRPLGLSKNILKKIANNLGFKYPLERYSLQEIIITRNILCGFEKDKLAKISPSTFREALPILRSIEPNCEQVKLATLASFAVQPVVFGEPSRWDAADVRGIGILLKGLAPAELKKIPAEAFLGVTSTVAEALTSDTLKELSSEQLSHIPRFSAQAMSSDQLKALSSQGRESLEGVVRGPLVTGHSNILRSGPLWVVTFVFITTVVSGIL